MRKVVQIAVAGCAENSMTQCEYVTVALCDDGTVWEITNRRDNWCPYPPITQEVKP